jgi:hypothetical protein
LSLLIAVRSTADILPPNMTSLVPFRTPGARYDLVIASPEKPGFYDPGRKCRLKITMYLLVVIDTGLSFTTARPIAHDFLAANPVTALENNDIVRNTDLRRLINKSPY